MSQREILQRCLGSLDWPLRRLAVYLGEHQTTVNRWVAGKVTCPAEVLSWLEAVSAPLRDLEPPALDGEESGMRLPTLEKYVEAMNWTRMQLSKHSGISVTVLEAMLEGRYAIPATFADWLQRASSGLRARPLPRNWVRHVDYISTPHALPIERVRADSPRVLERQRRKAEAQKVLHERAAAALARAARRSEAYRLRKQEGLLFREIAEILKTTHQTVCNLVAEEEARLEIEAQTKQAA